MATQTELFTQGTNGAAVTFPPRSEKNFRSHIHDHPDREEFTVDRSIFTDPELFNLEMRALQDVAISIMATRSGKTTCIHLFRLP